MTCTHLFARPPTEFNAATPVKAIKQGKKRVVDRRHTTGTIYDEDLRAIMRAVGEAHPPSKPSGSGKEANIRNKNKDEERGTKKTRRKSSFEATADLQPNTETNPPANAPVMVAMSANDVAKARRRSTISKRNDAIETLINDMQKRPSLVSSQAGLQNSQSDPRKGNPRR